MGYVVWDSMSVLVLDICLLAVAVGIVLRYHHSPSYQRMTVSRVGGDYYQKCHLLFRSFLFYGSCVTFICYCLFDLKGILGDYAEQSPSSLNLAEKGMWYIGIILGTSINTPWELVYQTTASLHVGVTSWYTLKIPRMTTVQDRRRQASQARVIYQTYEMFAILIVGVMAFSAMYGLMLLIQVYEDDVYDDMRWTEAWVQAIKTEVQDKMESYLEVDADGKYTSSLPL
ncbi:hypothetical protein KIPB_009440 [Kipferlia bialata]|uniref:Uncharacterized protein n=1 Tax=Kipferlia bialata TaxID=797122 RepID=A0A9K3D2C6_9EUKA|nr:hypothetical protein KIPB_009440 [Kipferlia bialata]|eukprot:g9440.t1